MKNGKRKKQASYEEIEKRVTLVLKLLTAGLRFSEIIEFCNNPKNEKTNWGLTERQIQNYIKKARDILKKDSKIDRNLEIGRSLARLNELYQKSLKIQDFKTCLAVQKELNSMLGLSEPFKVDHTSKGEKIETAPLIPTSKEAIEKAQDLFDTLKKQNAGD